VVGWLSPSLRRHRCRRSGADACVRYLGNKRDFLRYDQPLQAGWPIATGVKEGAGRHLIADRLSLGGARWGLDGAEAVLALRAVIASGTSRSTGDTTSPASTSGSTPELTRGQYALGA
jgi:hypothetical protein